MLIKSSESHLLRLLAPQKFYRRSLKCLVLVTRKLRSVGLAQGALRQSLPKTDGLRDNTATSVLIALVPSAPALPGVLTTVESNLNTAEVTDVHPAVGFAAAEIRTSLGIGSRTGLHSGRDAKVCK